MEKKELKKYSVKTKFFRAITYGVLVLLALICIVPFYNMIINCTHDNAALATSFQMTPGKSLKTNYQHLAANVNIWRGLLNSLFISLASTVITVYVGRADSLRLCQHKFKYNKQLFWLVLATMMLPPVGNHRVFPAHEQHTYAGQLRGPSYHLFCTAGHGILEQAVH